MLKLSAAPKKALLAEDVISYKRAHKELQGRLKTPKLSATSQLRIQAALSCLDDIIHANVANEPVMNRAADLMQKVATDQEIYPLEIRDRRIEEFKEKFEGAHREELSLMPVAGGVTVEIDYPYRDEPQNRDGVTRHINTPNNIAEDIMVGLDRELWPNAQEAFDGHIQEGGPYGIASFAQKKELAGTLRSYGFIVEFDEDKWWGVENERRKGNKHPAYQKAQPKEDLKLALGMRLSSAGYGAHPDMPTFKQIISSIKKNIVNKEVGFSSMADISEAVTTAYQNRLSEDSMKSLLAEINEWYQPKVHLWSFQEDAISEAV